MLETEVGQLLADGAAQLRNGFSALSRKCLAATPKFSFELLQLAIDAKQLSISLFQVIESALGLFAAGQHVRQCRAVFALEGMDQIQALLELLQARWIDLDLIGIAR